MFQLVSAADQASLSMTRSETQRTDFLTLRLIFDYLTGRSNVGDGGWWYNPLLKISYVVYYSLLFFFNYFALLQTKSVFALNFKSSGLSYIFLPSKPNRDL